MSLELAVAAHVTLLLIGVSWAFGGNADWVRTPIAVFASLGFLATLALVARRGPRSRIETGTLHWIWPVAILNALVFASCLTPGFRSVATGGVPLMIPLWAPWWIPTVTSRTAALHALWLFDGIYFSCLNLALAVRHRRTLRILFGAAVANAAALAVFGTVQKLVGSTGIFFGAIDTPGKFFASFVYDNHWGAFIILMMGACIGLTLGYAYGRRGEGFFKGPAASGLVAATLLAISVPLSGARACTLLLGFMVAVALARGVPRISAALLASGVPRAGVFAGMAAAAIVACAGAWLVAGDTIEARALKTREQVSEMWVHRGIGSRTILYRDTWRMAKERILFGWGMGSFPTVFGLYNTQESKIDHIPVVYHDAHSDWLQSVAEIGLAGTAMIAAAVLLPARALRKSRISTLPFFLLVGCVLVGAYAWVEFPFGNVAVVLAWWLSFFGAVQYVRLTAHPDGVQHQP
jgi:O-antigen ligase